MKKIVWIFLLFLVVGIKINASSWMFVWDETTTTIEIPLGGNLQNYISIPKASLYKNQELLQDAEIHYLSTGDWLYLLTDVDTTQVGTYQVWYKAIESKYQPGQCQGYKTLVTFHVVDQEAPVFTACPKEMIYWIGGTKPNYLEQILAVDNSGNCKITIDDSLVDYQTPGVYSVVVRATDSNFITEEVISLSVKDPVGPVITFLGENNQIVLTKGDSPAIQKYFKAVDKIDGDVTTSISYLPFLTDQEQSFDLDVSFSDKNGNISTMKINVVIVDKDEVKIDLYKNPLVLDYKSDFISQLRDNIKSAFLGNQNIIKEIEIHAENVKNEVGSYLIQYTYEHKGNEEIVECELKLLSNSSPILLVENIYTSINEKPDILKYIQVYDVSDQEITNKIEFDDSAVDYSQKGTYPVPVSITNSSLLSSSEVLYITVSENGGNEIESSKTNFVIPLLCGIVILGGGIIGFIYFKKKRNCNTEQNQL